MAHVRQAQAGQHAIDHRACLAQVVRGITQALERGPVEMLGDLRVAREQVDERAYPR